MNTVVLFFAKKLIRQFPLDPCVFDVFFSRAFVQTKTTGKDSQPTNADKNIISLGLFTQTLGSIKI